MIALMAGAFKRKGNWLAEDAWAPLGRVRGEVSAKGTVVVGDQTEVKGEIRASGLVVWGTVHGTVRIAGRVEVLSGGVMVGTISARSLRADDGASVKATLTISPVRGAE